MTRAWIAAVLVLALGAMLTPQARADFELTDDKGRRILLKDDGTWRYGEAASGAKPTTEAKPPPPQAELHLTGRIDTPAGCHFDFVLSNTLPYEIRSFVPEIAVVRGNGVIYNSQSVGFGFIKPGDKRQRSLRFDGIACADVAKLQMLGGDRCEMGDLDRYSDAKGMCLARVRIAPTDLVKFEK